MDQPFTYALPETLRHRARPGSRIVAPFGPRKLTGVILRCHDEPPAMAAREALRLIDSEPVLDAELLRWALDRGYYCALWAKCYAHAAAGIGDSARQGVSPDRLRPRCRAPAFARSSPDDPVFEDPAYLERRPLSARLSCQDAALADKAMRSLERKDS